MAGVGRAGLAIGGLAALVAGLALFAATRKTSDADQIRAALAAAIDASRDGRPGGALDLLSNAFEVNGEPVSGRAVASAIRRFRPDLAVVDPTPIVLGGTAHILSPVEISARYMGRREEFRLDSADFEFQTEPSTAYLFIPVRRWRLVKVSVDPAEVDGIAAALGQAAD